MRIRIRNVRKERRTTYCLYIYIYSLLCCILFSGPKRRLSYQEFASLRPFQERENKKKKNENCHRQWFIFWRLRCKSIHYASLWRFIKMCVFSGNPSIAILKKNPSPTIQFQCVPFLFSLSLHSSFVYRVGEERPPTVQPIPTYLSSIPQIHRFHLIDDSFLSADDRLQKQHKQRKEKKTNTTKATFQNDPSIFDIIYCVLSICCSTLILKRAKGIFRVIAACFLAELLEWSLIIACNNRLFYVPSIFQMVNEKCNTESFLLMIFYSGELGILCVFFSIFVTMSSTQHTKNRSGLVYFEPFCDW